MHHVPAADCAISVYAGALEGIGHAVAAKDAEVDRSGECLLKQPRLAEAGSAFDDDHRADPRAQPRKSGQHGVEVPVPASQTV